MNNDLIGGYLLLKPLLPSAFNRIVPWIANGIVVAAVAVTLAQVWLPIGPEKGLTRNLILVVAALGGLLLLFQLFQAAYPYVLRWSLDHKGTFLLLPLLIVMAGGMAWRGFDGMFGWLPESVRSVPWSSALFTAGSPGPSLRTPAVKP